MLRRQFLRLMVCVFGFIGREKILASDPQSKEESQFKKVELTEQNYNAWRDHVLPDKADLSWQQIPWLTTFQDGILEANERRLPLLFWTMNGHPLGCT